MSPTEALVVWGPSDLTININRAADWAASSDRRLTETADCAESGGMEALVR